MTTDPIMDEIMAATAVLHGGDRPGGRSRLEAIWSRIANDPAPIHECALARSMADAQEDVSDELAWDLRALEAALRCTDADARSHSQAFSIAAFMPSLYANLAEDYFKLGDLAQSEINLASARNLAGDLADDAYGQLIQRGIERLGRQLDSYR